MIQFKFNYVYSVIQKPLKTRMYVLTRTNWSKLCARYFILDGLEPDWTQDQIGSNWVGSLHVYMYGPQNRRQIKGGGCAAFCNHSVKVF